MLLKGHDGGLLYLFLYLLYSLVYFPLMVESLLLMDNFIKEKIKKSEEKSWF